MRKLTSSNNINKSQLERTCGMAHTISQIGGRWKLSILGLLVDNRKLRFTEMAERIPGISDRMLSLQLKELEHDGLITKETFPEVPPRVLYELTGKGISLKPVLTAMSDWGEHQLKDKKM